MAATLSARWHAHFAPLHDRHTTDAELLARYAHCGDELAFGLLVRRHGGMVAAVCRRRLRHTQDAEDATQAALLALARKAGRVHGTAPVAAWLYGAAVKACREVLRRRARKPWAALTADVPGDASASPDAEAVAAVLDEVATLTEAYRAAVVLCELEGRPRAAAARELGIAEGTLSSRLAAARKQLAERLTRRGHAPAAAALLVGLAVSAAAPAFDPSGPNSATTLALLEAIMRTGVTWKLKLGSTLCALGAGLGLALAGGPGPDEPTPRPPKPARTETKPAEPKFVLADVTPRKEFVDPPVIRPARLTLATFGADGQLTTRTTDLTPVHDAILKLTGTKPASKPTFEVLAYGPGGRSIVHGLYVMEKTAFTELMPIGFIKRDLEQRCKAVLETPTGRLVVLNDGLKSDTPGFLWSPDGGTVYSVVSDSSEMLRPTPPFIFRGTSHVTTRIDVATGERQRLALPDNAMPLGFSPDGKTLLLRTTKESLFKDDESQLFVATLAEDPKQPATLRALTQLKKGYEGHYGAQYSPDGKRAILTKTGFMPYPLDLMPAKERPKDSTSIPLYPVRRYEILDLATDTITPLTTQPTAVPDFAREVRWSPDGTRVAFADAKGWSHGAAGMQVLEPHVVSCDPDGRDPVKVPFPMPVGPERFSYGGYGNYGPSLVGWR